MPGFGLGPYGYHYGFPYPTQPVETPADLSSSRMVDGVKKRYVVDENGGFEPMNDIDQRVLLTMAFTVKDADYIASRDLRTQELRLRKALTDAQLAGGRSPSIKILALKSERSGSGEITTSLRYQNLITNSQQTITR